MQDLHYPPSLSSQLIHQHFPPPSHIVRFYSQLDHSPQQTTFWYFFHFSWCHFPAGPTSLSPFAAKQLKELSVLTVSQFLALSFSKTHSIHVLSLTVEERSCSCQGHRVLKSISQLSVLPSLSPSAAWGMAGGLLSRFTYFTHLHGSLLSSLPPISLSCLFSFPWLILLLFDVRML